MSISNYMLELGQHAKRASAVLASATTRQKNQALALIADALDSARELIKTENQKDLEQGKIRQLSSALLDRLTLTDARIDSMIKGIHQIILLPDPVGTIQTLRTTPQGFQIGKMRTPLGVIGMIYESRPNVTIDAATLCLKSGNAIILRGGSEAIHSNKAIANCIIQGLKASELPIDAVQLVNYTDRSAVDALITLKDYVDVIIPRGGKSLISHISKKATVPVIKHLDGICHVYVDKHADLAKALTIAINAKCYRYGICGAMETLLVHQEIAASFLPLAAHSFNEKGVLLKGCEQTHHYLPDCEIATETDWQTEYLAPILSIRVVNSIDQAITHINHYGSHHTDSIVSEHSASIRQFMTEVDSSSVMHNLPTCFADGFEYGLGAEIGISTNKLHVRGPVGLEGLTTEKFVVYGDGQTRG